MLLMALSYLVRERDVLTGRERWVTDGAGAPVIFDDRLAADLVVLISCGKASAWKYAYVAEIDMSVESITV